MSLIVIRWNDEHVVVATFVGLLIATLKVVFLYRLVPPFAFFHPKWIIHRKSFVIVQSLYCCFGVAHYIDDLWFCGNYFDFSRIKLYEDHVVYMYPGPLFMSDKRSHKFRSTKFSGREKKTVRYPLSGS
jgi:hypothetical protein